MQTKLRPGWKTSFTSFHVNRHHVKGRLSAENSMGNVALEQNAAVEVVHWSHVAGPNLKVKSSKLLQQPQTLQHNYRLIIHLYRKYYY